jgi:RNA polymerase sigma-70 factor (sigma-E family)
MADDAQVTAFIRANSATLYRAAFLLTGSAHAAEELVQDTLVVLYPKWDAVAGADSPVAYVRRALANRFLSSRRKASSRDVAQWEFPDAWDGRDLGESVATSAEIWQLLATLPERQRAAIVLRYFYDLPEADIGATIGCRPATVRTLVSRGLAALRSNYRPPTAAAAEPNGGGR